MFSRQQSITACLFSAAFFGALGSSFIYGYNLSVVNAPALVSQTVDFYEMVLDSQHIPVSAVHQHHCDKKNHLKMFGCVVKCIVLAKPGCVVENDGQL